MIMILYISIFYWFDITFFFRWVWTQLKHGKIMENMNFIECNWNKYVVQTMKIILEKEHWRVVMFFFLLLLREFLSGHCQQLKWELVRCRLVPYIFGLIANKTRLLKIHTTPLLLFSWLEWIKIACLWNERWLDFYFCLNSHFFASIRNCVTIVVWWSQNWWAKKKKSKEKLL